MKNWFRRHPVAAAVAARPTAQPSLPMMISLEPRIMFDAAVGATAAIAEPAHAEAAHPVVEATHVRDDLGAPRAVAAPAPAEARHEIVFVDTRVPDYQKLVDAVAPGVEVVLLDTHTDGVQQIADTLATRHDIDAVHIISHGDDGLLLLGSGPLFNGNVDHYTAQLATIGHALKADGDILLYGCEVGAGADGAAFLAKLADATGADVAASTNGTGTATRGGDWQLEIATGSIGASQALVGSKLASYDELLVTTSVNSVAGLKAAIATGNTDGVADLITLTGNITFATAADAIVINVTDGQTMSIAGGSFTLSGNNLARVIDVTAGTVAIDHLTITNGFVTGAGGNTPGTSAGLAGGDALGGGIRNAGTLTITDSTISANKAAGGGGGGGGNLDGGGGGGGGGGFGTTPGGAGGSNHGVSGGAGTAGAGGTGAGFAGMGGVGGQSSGAGGAGSTYGNAYTLAGNGGSANNGSIKIGGGGGGAGYDFAGGRGGNAAAAVYNTGTLTITTSAITGNIAAGGGGGGGSSPGGLQIGNGGDAGSAAGGIWNAGGTVRIDATTNTSLATGNAAQAGGIGFSNLGSNGAPGVGMSGINTTNSGTTITNFVPNAAPVVANLGGDSVSYTEGAGSATLLDSGGNATVADSDSADFNTGNVTVSIVTNRVSGEDVLGVRNEGSAAGQIGVSGSNITYGGVTIGTVGGGTGTSDLVITFNSASATPAAVQALVRNLTYANSNGAEPGTAGRSVRITVNDGDGGTSSNAVVSVAVVGINDAPTLSATGGTPTFTENGGVVDLFSGVTVSAVEPSQTLTGLSFTVTNVVDGASEIIGADGSSIALTNGNSGTTTTNSLSFSVTLSGGTATVTLTKAGGISSAAAQTLVDGMTYRNTSEAPGTTARVVTLTSISDNGGTANGGVDTTTLAVAATVSVAAVNDAPTLSGGPYALTGTDEDTTSAGTLVSTMLAGLTHGDVDASPASGIAITTRTGNGTWQYSTDGITWNGVGAVSGGASLLLNSTTRVRYVPDGANGETATLSFRAWDQTSGTASTNSTRNTVDTGSNGTTTAFSTGSAQASIVVTSVNDAPVLTPATPVMSGLTDGDVNNAGQTVAAIVGGSIADADSGAVQGIAVTGLVSGNGTWQYSLNGTTWTNVGTVSAGSALLLRSTDHLRFVPDGVNATTGSISYLGWDQTGASAGQQGSKVDASSAGGSSAFSSVGDTAGITVTAVNDAPTVTASVGSAAFTEADGATSTPVVVDSGLTLADSDSPSLASATVSITGNFQSTQDVLSFTNDGATMGNISASYSSGTGVLTLSSSGSSATLAQWQAALRSVTYTNSSDTPSTATRTISFVANDGSLDSAAATRTVSVASVNDTPVITLPATFAVAEDTPTALTGISFSDADAGGASVTVTLSVASGTLTATSGGGVTVGGTGTARTLSGSVAGINAFIAGSNLGFTPASNATGDVALTAAINDGGNTGSGGAKSASQGATLQVAAVNDAPTIAAPGSIAVTEDVTTTLTGISFGDVDAGSGTLSATLTVGSGTLAATSGSGVVVAGSGTGTLTLSGTLANLNAFIAAGGTSFTTAANAASNVTLSVAIDDGGNTGADPGNSGTGTSEAASTTVTLAVSAVNDAPVNGVPAAQGTRQDQDLVFSSGSGNLLSVSDVDAGGNSLQVTLTVTHGLLTLSGTTGLSFSVGSGTGDATMTFTGSAVDINTALAGLSFSPTAGYVGAASLQITTDDQGSTGSGGAKSDTDTIAITVNPINPVVTTVQSGSPDGGYRVGDTVLVTVGFDMAVTVDTSGGTPTLLLETGTVDRNASYVSGSGSNTLTFSYTVQAGDSAADLDAASTAALALNGATIRSASSDNALLTLPAIGGGNSLGGQSALVIDGIAPTITSVAVPANASYVAGQNLDFSVQLSEAVTVDTSGGTPRIAVTLDTGGTVFASYLSGSGTGTLVFRLTVASGQLDSNGISVGGSLDLNGATVRDAVGNNAAAALNGVASTAGVLVDAVVPTVASVGVPANGVYDAGNVLTFTVNTSEAVIVNSTGGTPRLAIDIGGNAAYADYVSGSGSSALTFQYTVLAGDTDADGIAVGALQPHGGTLRDAAGNDLAPALGVLPSTAAVLVDTTAPTGIVRVEANPNASASVVFTVTFSENVTGVDAGDFTLVAAGTAAGQITGVTLVDAHTYTVQVGGINGSGSLRLDLNGSGIVDAAGNPLSAGLTGPAYTIDRVAPAVTGVSVPADGTYAPGQALNFEVQFSEAVLVIIGRESPRGSGTPRLFVMLDNGGYGFADYVRGSGTSTLVFSMPVTSGQLDTNGITLGNAIDDNGGALRDVIGNTALPNLNNVATTGGVRVDAVAPAVTTVGVPANGAYKAGDVLSFTINTSEAVIVDSAGGTPRLAIDIGGSTAYANYVSGSGGTALQFQYTVLAGDADADGIAVGALQAHGGTLRDAAGNNLAPTLASVPSTAAVLVDTTSPTPLGIVRVDPSPASGNGVRYTISFSEDVSGLDAGDLVLSPTSTVQAEIVSVTQVDARTYTVLVGGLRGDGLLGLDLKATGTGITDAAGNALTGGLVGERYVLRPIVVLPPAPAEAPPPAPAPPPLITTPAAPSVTLSPMDPISPVSTPTLPPVAGAGSGSSLVVVGGGNSFAPDALAPPAVATVVAAAPARGNFIEVGAATGSGLQAMPEIGNFNVPAGQPVSIALPSSTFSHTERNVQVSVEVRLADGRPLPSWLKFDPVNGTLSGQPPRGLTQKLAIEVIARDSKGNRATSHLEVDVKGAPAAAPGGGTPAPRPADKQSLLSDPLQPLQGSLAWSSAPQGMEGRASLQAQFDRHGLQARQAERAALLEHAREAAQPAG